MTDAAGAYEFAGLPAGSYIVRAVQPAAFEERTFPGGDGTHRPTLSAAGTFDGDFGFRRTPGGLYGTVFNDLDADGVQDGGEAGQPGVTVFLDTIPNGVIDSGAPVSTTNPTDVTIPSATAGTVTSTIDVAGLGSIFDVNVSVDIVHTWDDDLEIALISPQGTVIDLASRLGGSADNYSVTLFDDEAANSITAGTPPFNGTFRPEGPLSALDGQDPNGTWTLRINDVFAADGGTLREWTLTITPAGEAVTTTDAIGNYSFGGLAAGTYTIVQIPPAGQTQTFPLGNAPIVVALGAGQSIGGLDFGNRVPPGAISGTKFNDLDRDGLRDAGEPGLPGVTIFLDEDNDGELDGGEVSTLTDANGDYLFGDLEPGQVYVVAEVVPDGFVQTSPQSLVPVPGPNVNVSFPAGGTNRNQTEALVAIDPTNTNRIFIASNTEEGGNVLRGAVSTDGGSTFTIRDFATGGDGINAACCDPTGAFDQFGNLWFSYLNSAIQTVVVLSTDGGATFTPVANLGGSDQPTLVTGPGDLPGTQSVWVSLNVGGQMRAVGTRVTGPGTFLPFGPLSPNLGAGNFGDIAVGPAGQVTVTYQNPSGGQGPSTIFVNTDPDGLGPMGFGAQVAATTTNVGGFDFIPAQPNRSVDAEAGLAYDRSGGPNDGRLYLMYTEETVAENNDTDILLRFSDDNGATFSAPLRVNDDAGTNSQFLPKIALDQSTGNLAVTWHDARNSAGNNTAELFGAVSTDGGLSFLPNIRISQGVSNQALAPPPPAGIADIDYGDYTGLDFAGGVFFPVWADNSNSTGDNPGGDFDIYTARVDFGTTNVHRVFVAPGATSDGNDFGNFRDAVNLQTVDDGQFPFRLTGAGWSTVTTGGAQGDYRLHTDGVNEIASNVARWTIQRSPGTYEVFVTWVALPGNATNATYSVFDGGTLKGTKVVDQTVAPDDLLLDGVLYESLGTFTITTTVTRIDLSSVANGNVVADAAFLSTPPAPPAAAVGGGTGRASSGSASRTAATGTVSLPSPLPSPAEFFLPEGALPSGPETGLRNRFAPPKGFNPKVWTVAAGTTGRRVAQATVTAAATTTSRPTTTPATPTNGSLVDLAIEGGLGGLFD